LSGVFEGITRDELHDFLLTKGAFVRSAVSGKTDYLIVGTKLEDGREVTQGGKYRGAKQKLTPILDESEFEQYVRDKTGLEKFAFASRSANIPALEVSDTFKGKQGEEEKDVLWTDTYRPQTP